MDAFLTSDGLIALVTLTSLEIVLGVDNLVFIAIVSDRLPRAQQPLARKIGLALALLTRVGLLFTISWMMGLTKPLFFDVSGRDLILIVGGLFLLFKATWEIYAKVEMPLEDEHAAGGKAGAGFLGVVVQIMVLDIVFSLDSVITAVGMVDNLTIMVTAVIIAMIVMIVAMERVTTVVEEHPSLKILALSFLILIGVILIADGAGHHVPKGYVYFSMAFALGVELLNIRYRGRGGRRRSTA